MSPRNSLAAALGKTLERDRAGGALATGPGEAETAYPRRSLPVQLAQIRVADRLQLALDEAKVATIAGSMTELGLQSPVLLRPWRAAGPEGSDAWGREDVGLFALVAGAHRLEAARRLGWVHIEALIVEGRPDEVRLIEIDENLARAELTVLDRARFLAARKRIHERMNPAQHRGGDRKSIEYAEESRSAKFALRSFSHDAMAHTGLSRRAVYRAVEIGKGLDDQAAADLAGTGLADREGDLHALSRIPASKQRVIAALCRASPRGATLGKALAALEGRGKRAKTTTGGRTPAGAGLAALQRAWRGADEETRRRFLDWIEGERHGWRIEYRTRAGMARDAGPHGRHAGGHHRRPLRRRRRRQHRHRACLGSAGDGGGKPFAADHRHARGQPSARTSLL